MGYIDQNLLPDEKVLFRTKKHLIIFAMPVVLVLLAVFAGNYMHHNFILEKLEWIPWLVALIFWGYTGIEYFASEFAVTNKRVMMKEGFFNRHINETRLNTISQVSVDQSLIGQILNYGTVSISAFGAYDSFTLIAKPFLFQRQVNQQLT